MKLFIATAATKKQLNNAVLVFGKTGEKVVTGLEALNKVFKHQNITNFLDLLKGDSESLERWANTKPGVKAIENLKIAGTAKSIEKVLAAVASIKSIPRQDKGVVIPKGKMLDGPKDDSPTYVGSYRPSVPVPSGGKNKAGKYELTDERVKFNGKTLYRIKALKSFGRVKAGDLGGYIQSEKNLSHDGNAWVYDTAQVAGNAKVSGNAKVNRRAKVYGNAKVHDYARVSDDARVYANSVVRDKAYVYGKAEVEGDAEVYGNAEVSDFAVVYGNAGVYGSARVGNYAGVYGNAQVYANSVVRDKAQVYGNAHVSGTAVIAGDQAVTR